MNATAAPATEVKNAKLEVIRKLLAKADGAATPEEAEAYTAKAVELMARHGIDQALLAATGEVKDVIGRRKVTIEGSYTRDKANLLAWVGDHMRVRVILHMNGKQVHFASIVGFESDLDRLELLYTSLLLQATGQVAKVRPVITERDRDLHETWGFRLPSTTAYRRTWFEGFASTVAARVGAAEKAAVAQAESERAGTGTPGTALVLADRQTLVDTATSDLFPRLGKARSRNLTGNGFGAGAAAGARADIGAKRVGGGRKALA